MTARTYTGKYLFKLFWRNSKGSLWTRSFFVAFKKSRFFCRLIQENLSQNLEASVFALSHGKENVLRTSTLVLAIKTHTGNYKDQTGHEGKLLSWLNKTVNCHLLPSCHIHSDFCSLSLALASMAFSLLTWSPAFSPDGTSVTWASTRSSPQEPP